MRRGERRVERREIATEGHRSTPVVGDAEHLPERCAAPSAVLKGIPLRHPSTPSRSFRVDRRAALVAAAASQTPARDPYTPAEHARALDLILDAIDALDLDDVADATDVGHTRDAGDDADRTNAAGTARTDAPSLTLRTEGTDMGHWAKGLEHLIQLKSPSKIKDGYTAAIQEHHLRLA